MILKRSIAVTIIVSIITILSISAAYASESIKIYINGKQLTAGSNPVVENGRTLVPLRTIFEALNHPIVWNAQDQCVTSEKIWLQIGNPSARVNGNQIKLDVPAKLINDKTYVPLRFVAESLDKDINWNSRQNTIEITDKKKTAATENNNNNSNQERPHYTKSFNKALTLIKENNIRMITIASYMADIWLVLPSDTNVFNFKTSETYNTIDKIDQEIDLLTKELSGPPLQYLNAYNNLLGLNNCNIALKKMLLDPGVSLNHYIDNINKSKQEFDQCYNELILSIPADDL